MRIAQIAPLFESVPPKLYGGTERVVHNLTRGLVAAGAEVTVFCTGDSECPGEIAAVLPEALRLKQGNVLQPSAYQIRMLEMVLRRAHEFDIIHNHYDYPLLPLARITPTPILSTAHNRLDLPELSAVLEMYSDVPLVSISNSQRLPLPTLNWVKTVYHGIEIQSFKFHSKPGGYLAFLGRFSPEKGAHLAIAIARKAGVPLKIAAKIDESNPEYYERMIKPNIDGKFIEYVGEISEAEKSDFLGNALALLNPIDWPEPFGLVMIEAMACGTPVLTRPVGSAPELVVDGLTGFLRTDLTELTSLIAAAPRLNRTAIRQYAEKNFSIERMTREYLNVYRQLIAGKHLRDQRDQAGQGSRPRRSEVRDQPAHARRVANDRWNIVHSVDGATDRNSKGVA